MPWVIILAILLVIVIAAKIFVFMCDAYAAIVDLWKNSKRRVAQPITEKQAAVEAEQPVASGDNSRNEKKGMNTVTFNHGKCDICGKEFMTLGNDPVSPLQEVEWSINNSPKVRKLFCNDCLNNFIASTTPTNKRHGEAEATESARKFWRFFGRK